MIDNEIEIKIDTKKFPIEYKLLEYRLYINQGLYDDGALTFREYNNMANNIHSRMKRIRTNLMN